MELGHQNALIMENLQAKAGVMDPGSDIIEYERPGVVRVYKSGRVERFDGTDTNTVPPCPSGDPANQFGPDHPYINPATSPGEWSQLGCGRVLVTTAELCWFVDRARAYAEGIKACGWDGEVEFHETKGEEHVYFLFKSGCDNAVKELAVVADFVGRC
ncbi:putative carboxylesterase 7 [Triticum urartu]|uniref:Putative carboxylesterase 7 n=1 Tax=Triticum urartu TaxID=4572 RepID=M7YQ44_TRIUA|nr:putative carboxylesterase 7 [Triticum urartu]